MKWDVIYASGLSPVREQAIPDSKVHGANMGPSGADRTKVGPVLAPWTLLSGIIINGENLFAMTRIFVTNRSASAHLKRI